MRAAVTTSAYAHLSVCNRPMSARLGSPRIRARRRSGQCSAHRIRSRSKRSASALSFGWNSTRRISAAISGTGTEMASSARHRRAIQLENRECGHDVSHDSAGKAWQNGLMNRVVRELGTRARQTPRMRSLVMLLACVACGDAPDRTTHKDAAAPSMAVDAALSAVDAGAVRRRQPVPNEGVLHRSCGRPSFGEEWKLDPKSLGITCRRQADCGTDPLTHCLGWSDGCDAAAADGCMIRSTLCRRDDCADDRDCPAGTRCVCPETGGDPWCIPDGCDDDGDCADGQRCRNDEAVQGVGPVQHCTTPDDACKDSSECTDPIKACGYDLSRHLWACVPIVIVD